MAAVWAVIDEGRCGTEGALDVVSAGVVVGGAGATEGVVVAACWVTPARSQGFGGEGMLIVGDGGGGKGEVRGGGREVDAAEDGGVSETRPNRNRLSVYRLVWSEFVAGHLASFTALPERLSRPAPSRPTHQRTPASTTIVIRYQYCTPRRITVSGLASSFLRIY